MQPRAPRGAGGGSRPGNVLTRRRQFITAMISLFEVILKGAFTWGHGGMEERSREGAGEREGEEFCPTIVW